MIVRSMSVKEFAWKMSSGGAARTDEEWLGRSGRAWAYRGERRASLIDREKKKCENKI